MTTFPRPPLPLFPVLFTLFLLNLGWTPSLVLGQSDDESDNGGAVGRGISFNNTFDSKLKQDGLCVPNDDKDPMFKKMCAFELSRGASWAQSQAVTEQGYSTSSLTKFCIEFNGFQTGDDKVARCDILDCYEATHSTTFWVLIIGIPISVIIALITLCWLCSHFAYYMCCCFIFHIELPSWLKKGQQKPASNRVEPAKSKATTDTAKSKAETSTPKPDAPTPKKEAEEAKPKEEVEKKEEKKNSI